jgi:hypothetical protein
MSSIGSSGAAYILPGSISGTQRNHADADRLKAEQATQKQQADRQDFLTGDAADVGETGESADRDADGRLPSPAQQNEQNSAGDPADPSHAEPPRRSNELGEGRGAALDLDA